MNPMVVRATAVLAGRPHNDDGHEDLRRFGLDVDSGMAANDTCLCHGPLHIGLPGRRTMRRRPYADGIVR